MPSDRGYNAASITCRDAWALWLIRFFLSPVLANMRLFSFRHAAMCGVLAATALMGGTSTLAADDAAKIQSVKASAAATETAGKPAKLAKLKLQKGDHICLVGNELGERFQHHNFWESLLHQRFSDLELTVRNLCF
ncbi:MAG: hypothetical protein AAFN70_12025, partial [Planctomycetota bacterium]